MVMDNTHAGTTCKQQLFHSKSYVRLLCKEKNASITIDAIAILFCSLLRTARGEVSGRVPAATSEIESFVVVL
jgi:hypothetical protein